MSPKAACSWSDLPVELGAKILSEAFDVCELHPRTLKHLIQVSSLCRKMASAVDRLVDRAPRMYLWQTDDIPLMTMSSKLLLRWAPKMQQVFLTSRSASYPGAEQFMAATGLREADIRFPDCPHHNLCDADDVTLFCCNQHFSESYQECWGWIEDNAMFLESDLNHNSQAGQGNQLPARDKSKALSCQLEGVLQSVCSMPLKKLTLSVGSDCEIRSNVVLPKVPVLHAYFLRRAGFSQLLDLSWVQHQPCDQLHIDLCVSCLHGVRTPESSLMNETRHTVHELQQLEITTLVLRVLRSTFTPAAQCIWAQLTDLDKLYLHFEEGFSGVCALPRCPYISVKGSTQFSDFDLRDPGQVSWSAIGLQPGRVHICLQRSQEPQALAIEGFTSLIGTGPWQLVVHSAASVQGLPPSRPCSESYILQNDAADAAGWDGAVLDSCQCQGPLFIDRRYEWMEDWSTRLPLDRLWHAGT